MAFPTIPTVGAGRVVTGVQTGNSATRTFPSLSGLTKNSGDLLIAIVWGYQSSLTSNIFGSWGGGFTEIKDIGVASQHCVGIAYKISNGSETGTFTVTQAGTVTGDAAFILLSIPGWHGTTVPEVSAALATGTSAEANPAALDPSGWGAEDTLWIVSRANGETSTSGTFTGLGAAPTNYGSAAQTGISQDAVGGIEAGVSFRQLNASSEDAGAGTSDLSNARNASIVIAVRGITVENHDGTATLTGGGTATFTKTTSRSRAGALTGGGLLAAAFSGQHRPAHQLVGGGVVTVAHAGAHKPSHVLTGGGTLTGTLRKGALRSQALTGGGALAVAHRKAALLAGALTGGGAVAFARLGAHNAAPSLTGGGSLVAGVTTARSRAQALSGGGVFVAASAKGGRVALVVTGGGRLLQSQASARALAAALTGGGELDVAYDVSSGNNHDVELVLSGGGRLVVALASRRLASLGLTGGGMIVVGTRSARGTQAALSGGGVLTVEPTTGRLVAVQATGGGSLVVAYSLLRAAMNAIGEIYDLPPEEIAEWFWNTRGLSSDVAVLTTAATDSLHQGNRKRARRLADASELLAAHFPAVDDGEVNDQVQDVPNVLRLQRRN